MHYSFHPEAEQELNDSIDYYNECQDNLGFEFAEEVHKSIRRILSFPYAWSPLSANTRRCITDRFPYGIIYKVTPTEVVVVAVMQLNKKPDSWKLR